MHFSLYLFFFQNNGLLQLKTNHIDIEILLLCLLLADIFNGIVTTALGLRNEEQQYDTVHVQVSMWVGFIFPLVAYFIVGMLSILYDLRKIYKDNEEYNDKCRKLRPSGLGWTKLLIKVCVIVGGIFYFVGDNLQTIIPDYTGITTLALSVVGVLIYRISPVTIKKLQSYCMEKTGEPQTFNRWSPNSYETHSLVVAYMVLLTIVIDFDVLFTVVRKKVDSNLCNRTDELETLWFFYGGMIGSFYIIEIAIAIIFIMTECRGRFPNLPRFKLKLSMRDPCALKCYIIWDFFLFLMVTAAVALYLVAENHYLLECYISQSPERTLRVIFLMFSFCVCIVVIIVFSMRKECHCIQLKGKITEVGVHISPDKVKVRYEEGNETRFFIYNVQKSEIDSDERNHAELYKKNIKKIAKHLTSKEVTIHQHALEVNDIEPVAKCLGGNGRLVAVKYQRDQNKITVVRNIGEHLYLVVHSTDNPINFQVYKVVEQKPEDWGNKNEEILQYTENNNKYSIKIHEHGNKKCAVKTRVEMDLEVDESRSSSTSPFLPNREMDEVLSNDSSSS